jgi:biotin synthase-related radical SAM superfamily protein
MTDYKKEIEEYKEVLTEYLSIIEEINNAKDIESLIIAHKKAMPKLSKMTNIMRKIRGKLKKDLLNEKIFP